MDAAAQDRTASRRLLHRASVLDTRCARVDLE
jgi:hypothetical protein